MNINSQWHHVDSLMPARGKYVLVETRYCKYPFITAYFNGIDWINADDKAKLMNVRYWADIATPSDNEGSLAWGKDLNSVVIKMNAIK